MAQSEKISDYEAKVMRSRVSRIRKASRNTDVASSFATALEERIREAHTAGISADELVRLKGDLDAADRPGYEREWSRVVAIVKEENGKRGLFSRRDGTQIGPDAEDKRSYATLPAGTIVVYEQRKGTNQWKLVEEVGQSGTLRAENRALAYEIGCDPIFPLPVRKEAAAIERLDGMLAKKFGVANGQGLIEQEVRKGTVSVLDADWQSKYQHGKNRADFRGVMTIGIDPKNAMDHDDVISYRKLSDTEVEIGVHIADVAHFVPFGREIQKEAWRRQFTAYLAGNTSPMLPSILSEELCSLKPGKDRLAFSTVFRIDSKTGNINDTWRGRTVINSNKQFTYEEADELCRKGDAGPEADMQNVLRDLQKYAGLFGDAREKRGALSLYEDRDEPEIDFDADGNVRTIRAKYRGITNDVIEKMMVAANEAAGEFMVSASGKSSDGTPFILREHAPPSLDDLKRIAGKFRARKISAFIDAHRDQYAVDGVPVHNLIIRELLKFADRPLAPSRVKNIRKGLENPANPLRDPDPAKQEQNFQEYLVFLQARERERLLSELRQLWSSATYTTEDKPHLALAARRYAQVTSPIRRYTDIMAQYLTDTFLHPAKGVSRWNAASADEVLRVAEHGTERDDIISDAQKLSENRAAVDLLNRESKGGKLLLIHVDRVEGERSLHNGTVLPPRVAVWMLLPKGNFPMRFRLSPDQFENFPFGAGAAMNDRIVVASFEGADMRRGEIKLKFMSEIDPEAYVDSPPGDAADGAIVPGKDMAAGERTPGRSDRRSRRDRLKDMPVPDVEKLFEGEFDKKSVVFVRPSSGAEYISIRGDDGKETERREPTDEEILKAQTIGRESSPGVPNPAFRTVFKPGEEPTDEPGETETDTTADEFSLTHPRYPGVKYRIVPGTRPEDPPRAVVKLSSGREGPPIAAGGTWEFPTRGSGKRERWTGTEWEPVAPRATEGETDEQRAARIKGELRTLLAERNADKAAMDALEKRINELKADQESTVWSSVREDIEKLPKRTTTTTTMAKPAAKPAAKTEDVPKTPPPLPAGLTSVEQHWPRPAWWQFIEKGRRYRAIMEERVARAQYGDAWFNNLPRWVRERLERHGGAPERRVAKSPQFESFERYEEYLNSLPHRDTMQKEWDRAKIRTLKELSDSRFSAAEKANHASTLMKIAEHWKNIPTWKKLAVSLGIIGTGVVATALTPASTLATFVWGMAVSWRALTAGATGVALGSTVEYYMRKRNYSSKRSALIGGLTAGATAVGTFFAGQKLAEYVGGLLSGRDAGVPQNAIPQPEPTRPRITPGGVFVQEPQSIPEPQPGPGSEPRGAPVPPDEDRYVPPSAEKSPPVATETPPRATPPTAEQPQEPLPRRVAPDVTEIAAPGDTTLERGSTVWGKFSSALKNLGLEKEHIDATALAFIDTAEKEQFKSILLGDELRTRPWSRIPAGTVAHFGQLLEDEKFVSAFAKTLESGNFRGKFPGVKELIQEKFGGNAREYISAILRDGFARRS
ncbi:MAG TPA: RNB domain-containing ribonuclease [Candidatus Paceibacterota bacterium]|nr:RNB domain-containing ribonuclease [Candidatus Paceibacterota bacterium]